MGEGNDTGEEEERQKVCRIARDLTRVDDLLVRKRAGELLLRCSENYPFLTLTEMSWTGPTSIIEK